MTSNYTPEIAQHGATLYRKVLDLFDDDRVVQPGELAGFLTAMGVTDPSEQCSVLEVASSECRRFRAGHPIPTEDTAGDVLLNMVAEEVLGKAIAAIEAANRQHEADTTLSDADRASMEADLAWLEQNLGEVE